VTRVVCAALVALVLVLAGCGGGGNSLYTRQATAACLATNGLKPTGIGGDFVASTATGGAFHVELPDNAVTVSFGQTLDDATNLDGAYRRFHAENVGIDDILRTQENAVMLWRVHPTDTDIATITDCLQG
jgi:hypothetical protein